ncbi:cupin domain-containing protein [Bacillus sp. V3B]|uniref:sugar phosphate nucleotidyltransferase n=1 Tax=Bacillus sp. V3B TaxID=2804915 RepID=UPI00210EF9DE|nr:sugar phosphate nucleotidyltransferase [Bacillus sp. V3B]MCQ6274857.1 cupin domain-containing protein [Bacillus sp. V3B]
MHVILLSGGSGQRLWPLSNDSRSKQFLKVFPSDKESNLRISMVQRVWQQLQRAHLADRTFISTNQSQVDAITNQLGSDLPLIIEPSRCDTYLAILLSSLYLYSIERVRPDEVVTVMPVDPYVKNDFFEHIKSLEYIVKHSTCDLALVGIQPTFPSEKYGYIVPNCSEREKMNQDYQTVRYFKEKPNKKEAQELVNIGALWNGGVFAFKLEFILNHLELHGLPLNYDEMIYKYNSLPKISFDYEVVEKTEDIVVVPYKGEWKDLGTWNTLTDEMGTHLVGNGCMSSDCKNVNIINELDIPVSVLGLSNLVVAVSPDGILVSDKEASSRVKEIINNYENRPMYEERRWGWYRVLDYTKFRDDYEVLTKRIAVMEGKNLSYQKHCYRHEVWTIISGVGLFALDGHIKKVKPGDVLQIPAGGEHGVKAITDLEFIEVQNGSKLIEEDIVRLFMTWEEVEYYCKSIDH